MVMKKKIKKILDSKYLPFVILFILMLILHAFIGLSNDDLYYKEQLDNMSLIDCLTLRYNTWSSRMIIETILLFIARIDINIWRIFDSLIYVLGCFVILKLVNKKDKKIINYIGCLLFLLYPFYDMSSAGFISTTLNYLWCFSLGVLSFLPIINYEQKKKNGKFIYIISSLSLFYAVNQEQMCAIVFGFNLLYLIYKIYKKERVNKYNIFCLIVCIASLIFIFTCPGNALRNVNEAKTWFEEYASYNIFDKIYLGVVPTINILLNNKIIIFFVFLILSSAVYIYSDKQFDKFLSLINVIVISSVTVLKPILLAIFPNINYIFEIFNLQAVPSLNKVSIFVFVVSIILVVDIAYMLYIIFKKKNLLPLFIFLAGFMSRFIIGFSPTIFASRERTAIFIYMSLIIVSLFVITKLYEDKKITRKNILIFTCFLLCFALFNYLDIFASLY